MQVTNKVFLSLLYIKGKHVQSNNNMMIPIV